MKIVFNFNTGSRALVGVAVAALLLTAAPAPARAQATYVSTRELLADFFHTSERVTFRKVTPDAAERARLTVRLGYAPPRSTYTFYVALSGARIDGYAFIDDELGEHLPITFAVKLSPAGVVERQEIVAYREARGDEVREHRFRKQFVGKTARDPIVTGADIAAISGATISSRAMAKGVKRAVVLFEELMKPERQAGRRAQAPSGSPGMGGL